MACMFYFAYCMNIIFNSLLAHLVKYDVHTTSKITFIHAICYQILLFSIHAILPVSHFPLLHFQSLPFMCDVAITATEADAAAAAVAGGGGRSVSSSATFHVNLSAVQCLLARVQPAVTIVVGTGDGRAARAVLRPAGRMARRIYDRNK